MTDDPKDTTSEPVEDEAAPKFEVEDLELADADADNVAGGAACGAGPKCGGRKQS
jgi:hypothetical protein